MHTMGKKKTTKLLVRLLIFTFMFQAFTFGDWLTIKVKAENDPFALMYDSNEKLIEEIDKMPQFFDADTNDYQRNVLEDLKNNSAADTEKSVDITSEIDLSHGITEKMKQQIKEIIENDRFEDIDKLDISNEVIMQINDINKDVKEDRYIVKYNSNRGGDLSEHIEESQIGVHVQKSNRDGKTELFVLDEKVNPQELAEALKETGVSNEIEYIQPDFMLSYSSYEDGSLTLTVEDNETDEGEEELGDTDQETTNTKDTDADYSETGGSINDTTENNEVIVAVIDTGIDITHPALVDYIWNNETEIAGDAMDNDGNGYIDDTNGWNFNNNNNIVYDSTSPTQEAHGTHIAGIITNQAADYNVKVMPLKAFGESGAYTSDIIEAIEYAEANGAQIVNCSFGSTDNNPALEEAFEASSILFVCSVGNSRSDLEEIPIYPACFELEKVISVTSTNADGGLSYYSNYSNMLVDVAALGRDVYSTLPNGQYGKQSGTSMAAAQVSGVAAAVLAVQNNLASALKTRLINTSNMLSNLTDTVNAGRQINLQNAVNNTEQLDLIQNMPADDFNVNGYNPTQSELYQLYSSSGKVVQVAAGYNYMLILKENGTVWAWGDNHYGQCGNGTTSYSETLTQVIGLTNVVKIAAGGYHSLAVKSDGTVWTWGYNCDGQLGDGTYNGSSMPVQVNGLTGAASVAAGMYHSMAVTSNGTAWAWGRNSDGQLGDGTTTRRTTPEQVNGLTGAASVVAGMYHSMAVTSNGTVWAWGRNSDGQLGDGTTTRRTTPEQVNGLTGAASVAGGMYHSMAVTSNGTVWAWGRNSHGQLGDSGTPVQVSGLTGVADVAAGLRHSLAVKSDGTVWAWGDNGYGQLGDGTYDASGTPVQVSGLTDVVGVAGVSAGSDFSLAVKEDGTVWAWGNNNYDKLGDGTTSERTTPVQVSGLIGVNSVAAGYVHSLAVKSDGTVWATGYGELGDGTTIRTTPVQVSGLTGVNSVAAGSWHSLAVKSDGTVWAWGDNWIGQLGDGTYNGSGTPVQVSGLTGVNSVAAGSWHSLAVKSDGTVWAWGDNWCGQLGDGTYNGSGTPVQVSGLTDVVGIASGYYHSLAVKSDGTVWAWGENGSGQLGDGSYSYCSSMPVQVSGLTDVVGIAAGEYHSLAVKSDGTVWAWGCNEEGELGDGTYDDSGMPVQVSGLTDVVGIAAAGHSLAVKSDGTVWAWGDNGYGQLGDGSYRNCSSMPVQVSGLTNVVGIAAGDGHSMAATSNGTVWAWGYDNYGQLGQSRIIQSSVPLEAQVYTAGTFDFMQDPYTACIPASGNTTVTVHAQKKDVYGNVQNISGIVYSLENTYAGVTIDSSTGVITVASTASVGSVQINASYNGASCSAALNLATGTDLSLSTSVNETYNISLTASNITSFTNRTFILTFDKDVLQLSDLCAFTYNQEKTAGSVSGTDITITDVSPGSISFTVGKTIASGKAWSGVISIFKFKALQTGSTVIHVI